MSFFQNIKYELQKHSKLTLLLIINISIFLIINISSGVFKSDVIALNMALPLNLNEFIFKFWTLFTYMFAHKDLGHVFYNMLLLYFTANTFLNFLSEKKLLYVYIMSGLMGGITLLILSAIFPASFANSILFGASAAVIGIVTSLAIYIPNLPVSLFGIIEMKYKYYALLVFVVSTIIDFNINTGGKISHFGGAFFGLLFGYLLKNGKDLSDLSTFRKQKISPLKVVHQNRSAKTTGQTQSNQQTIDALLDKISKSGYENLTKAEKELLFKLSQKK
ncbi:MAG: rhomboid family protease GlpG [Bacteroidetes bacterium]|jgi:membrane associated rhomboid family serine protease|nr:rhomboid family protease GlpG [Bacteroidota bacterium]